jgi:hypothetical protein
MILGCLRIPPRLSLLLFVLVSPWGDENHKVVALSNTNLPVGQQLNIAFVTGNKMKVRPSEGVP